MLAVGKALGSFQQVFMVYNDSENPELWRTVAHKDFHTGNIFFDALKDQIYFIDNDTMEDNSLITTDINMMLSILSKYKSIYKISPDDFIKGYLESFPIKQRTALETYFKQKQII